jgi:aspartyl-tRNA(Asn)/glutamyl-tRNA(Gln) amidotransferase subunit C
MALKSEEIAKIAWLARLGVEESEYDQYAQNLSNILAFVEQLDAVDTTGVTPLAHPLDAAQRLREDKVSESDQRENFQKIAPKTEAGLYLVPKVIE